MQHERAMHFKSQAHSYALLVPLSLLFPTGPTTYPLPS